MTGVLTHIWLMVLLGWVAAAFAGLRTDPLLALIMGMTIGVVCVVGLRETVALRGLVALLEPIGIILPILAMRHLMSGVGVPVAPFSTAELLVFLLVYVAFLAASMGVVPVDAYRLGYAPVPVAAMVLVLCAYGALSGNIVVPLIAVLGQFLWVMGWGSSNWFDHVLHAVLVPVVLVMLIGRLVW